jgi:hypothetical protein
VIVNIFFSLFSSSTKAYGSVSGRFEVPESIEKGHDVLVLHSEAGDWFGGTLKVESITRVPNQQELLVGLRDVVAKSSDDAARLGKKFEVEAGLFCDPYD